MKTKDIVIVVLTAIIVLLLGGIIGLKRSYDREIYAITHNCEWHATGTMYGDDRDFICKQI